MIIAGGKLLENSRQSEITDGLEERINRALEAGAPKPETVIGAVVRLGERLKNGEFDSLIDSLGIEGAGEYKNAAISLMSREALELRLETELGGELPGGTKYVRGSGDFGGMRVKRVPLGTLLHIAAGNAEGLPAYSLAEGLITGNVNVLKLPQADNGLSVKIIMALLEEAPELSEYVYVFDTPSTDIPAILKLAGLADGIAVWGSDEAVSAVRRFASPGTRLIEWGHKLSFAYVSGEYPREDLEGLAEHIASTRQLLCSSCQTVFIDTDSMDDVRAFCDRFLPVLEAAAERRFPKSPGGAAQMNLKLYTDRLRSHVLGERAGPYTGRLCSLIPCEDGELVSSPPFLAVPVKRLPEKDLFSRLRTKKQWLQTAGLICRDPRKRIELEDKLIRCGITRITDPENMSRMFAAQSHDGEYPLRRYTRTADILDNNGGTL